MKAFDGARSVTFCLLMTCAGGELAPYLIGLMRSSTRHRIRVVAVDANADAIGRRVADAFYQVPLGTEPHYVDAVAEIVQREKVDLVLPTSDEEALALAQGRERIQQAGARVAAGEFDTLTLFSNKIATYERLARAGFELPAWHLCRDKAEIAAAARSLMASHRACVVKPAVARGGRGVSVIRSDVTGATTPFGGRELHMDLETFLATRLDDAAAQAPAIVMERLEAPVYDVDMLAWEGRPIRVVARRRVDSALPNEGHVIVNHVELERIGRKIAEAVTLTWLFDCDIMLNAAGRPCILEINPRPSGSVSASITAGVPLLDDLVSLAKGESVPAIDMPYGRVVVPIKALTQSAARAV